MRRILLFLSLLMLLPTFARAEETLYSFDTNTGTVGSVDQNATFKENTPFVMKVNGQTLTFKGFGNSAGNFDYLAIGKKATINTNTNEIIKKNPATHTITSGQIGDEITSISFTVSKRRPDDGKGHQPLLTGARLYIATKSDFSDAVMYSLYQNDDDKVNGNKFDVVNTIKDKYPDGQKVISLRLTDYNNGEPLEGYYYKLEFDTDGGSNDPMWLFFQNITFSGNHKSNPTHSTPVVNFDKANSQFTLSIAPSKADADTNRKIYYYVDNLQNEAPEQGDARWIEYTGAPVKYKTEPGNYFVHSYVAAGDPAAFNNSATVNSTNFYKVWNTVPEGKIKTIVLNNKSVSQSNGVARDYRDELGINYNSKALNTKETAIEINNNSYGIATTDNTREYKVKAIEVEWANNPRTPTASMDAYRLNVYGSNTAYANSDELFVNENELKPITTIDFKGTNYFEFSEAVPFIGLRAQKGTHYIKEIRIYYDMDSPIHYDYNPGFEKTYERGATSVTTLNVVKNLKAEEIHPELNISVETVSGDTEPIVVFDQTTVPSNVSEIKFTAKNPGEAKVTVSWARTDYWNGGKAEFNVTVIQPALAAPKINLSSDLSTFNIDAADATTTDADCVVKYAFTKTANMPALESNEWKVYSAQADNKLPEYTAADFGNDLEKVFYVHAYVEPSKYNVDNKIYSNSADVSVSYKLTHPEVSTMFIAVDDMKLAGLESVASVDFDYKDPATGEVYQFNVGRVNDKGALTGQFNFYNKNIIDNVRRVEIVVKNGEVYPNKVIVATGESMLSTVQSVGVNGVKSGNNVIFDILPTAKYFRLQATEKEKNSFAANTTIEGFRIYYFDSGRKTFNHNFTDRKLDITDSDETFELGDFDGDINFGDNKIVKFEQDKVSKTVKIIPIAAGTETVHFTWGDDNWKDGSATFKITITKATLVGVDFGKLDDNNNFAITETNSEDEKMQEFVDGIYYKISKSSLPGTPNDSWTKYEGAVHLSGNGLYYVHAYVKSKNSNCDSSPVVTTSYDVFVHSITELLEDIDNGSILMVKSGNNMVSQESVMIRFDDPLVVYGRYNNALYAYQGTGDNKRHIRITNIPTSNPIRADIAALNATYVIDANGRDYFQYDSHEEVITGQATTPEAEQNISYHDVYNYLNGISTQDEDSKDYLYRFVYMQNNNTDLYPNEFKNPITGEVSDADKIFVIHYNGNGEISVVDPMWYKEESYDQFKPKNAPMRAAVQTPETHTNVLKINDDAIKNNAVPGFYKGIEGYVAPNASGTNTFVATKLDAKDIVTSVKGVNVDNGEVKVVNGAIVAPEGSEVYTISGIRVADSNVEPGMYIVRLANGKAVKVQVK